MSFLYGNLQHFSDNMKIRRVVTGHNEKGQSVVKWDSEIEGIYRRPGCLGFEVWATKELPVKFTDDDPNEWELGTSLSNGSVFRLVRYEPGAAKRWHKTDSIDYAIVLSGEMYMQLDTEDILLKAGDVVVQRGTIHNWDNRGPEPCVMAFILIAKEGGGSTGWEASR